MSAMPFRKLLATFGNRLQRGVLRRPRLRKIIAGL
jgi:hypothetical protein